VYPVSEEAAVRRQDIAKRRSKGEHRIVRSLPAHGERTPEDVFELVVCVSGKGANILDSAARMLPNVKDLVEEGVYVAFASSVDPKGEFNAETAIGVALGAVGLDTVMSTDETWLPKLPLLQSIWRCTTSGFRLHWKRRYRDPGRSHCTQCR
jgi:hypothetical protein